MKSKQTQRQDKLTCNAATTISQLILFYYNYKIQFKMHNLMNVLQYYTRKKII